jgi:parvulin-like peptidyl-prolyl isomerase
MKTTIFKPVTLAVTLGVTLQVSATPQQKPPYPTSRPAQITPLPPGEMLEAVVATVNEVPITLTDIQKRLSVPRKLTLLEASRDTEFKQVLDAVILERLIEEEAKAKRLETSSAEIEEYINEVAQRNGLDRPAFESALASENKSLSDYRKQVRVEILKSKLLSASVRGSVSISDTEIDNFLKENPESAVEGATVKLRQILVKTDGRSGEEAEEKIHEILKKIDDGQDFASIARASSESPDAAEGGLLGTVAEKDLSTEIYDAISSLDAGKVSDVVRTQRGLLIFKVEEKADGASEDDDEDTKIAIRREAARKALMDRKAQEKLSSFFVHDLYQSHSVEKKI